MYSIYRMVNAGRGRWRYIRLREAHLFGCNVGEIPRLLRQSLPALQEEPYPWHLDVERAFRKEGAALVIHLKPRDRRASLYQVRDAWGYSAYGWTPVMLRLRGLLVDGRPKVKDPSAFAVGRDPEHEAIHTFFKFNGTVQGGRLTGHWTSTRPSATNSVLLWSDALRYFMTQTDVGSVRQKR